MVKITSADKMAYSSAGSGNSHAHAGSGGGGPYSYAGSDTGGWFSWPSGAKQHASSSSSSSGPGGHFHSSTMTSGPDGTFGTYHSSDDPGRVYTWGGEGGQTVYSNTRSPHGASSTMTSTSGNGRSYCCIL